jgi:hypothetical protein
LSAVPVVVVLLPLEGSARAYVVCRTWEEEQRVWAEVAGRDPMGEIEAALRALLEVFEEQRREGRA